MVLYIAHIKIIMSFLHFFIYFYKKYNLIVTIGGDLNLKNILMKNIKKCHSAEL